MDRVLVLPRRRGASSASRATATTTARPPRTREPRGILPATDASRRMAPLVGKAIAAVDASLGRTVLTVAARPAHLVVVAAPLTVVATDHRDPQLVEPGAASLRVLAGWVGCLLTEVRVEPTGALRLACAEAVARIPADPVHEAWEVRGMDGGLLACLPGGSISLWTPTFGRIPAGS